MRVHIQPVVPTTVWKNHQELFLRYGRDDDSIEQKSRWDFSAAGRAGHARSGGLKTFFHPDKGALQNGRYRGRYGLGYQQKARYAKVPRL